MAGAGQNAAADRAVVDPLVVDDEVLGTEQVPDGRDVGGVPAREHDRGLGAEEPGDLRLQLVVQRRLPHSSGVAELDVPYRSIAALAASRSRGWADRAR